MSALRAVFLIGLISFRQSSVTPRDQLVRDIYKQLIEINTTDSAGDCTKAAEAMAARLRVAGYPEDDVKVGGPDPRKRNLVARLHGTGAKKPLLLLAHLDVVEARREDWSMDPFKFIEQDSYYYGRGTSDDKDMAAIWIATLIQLKQEGFKPNRDLIVALTADEEGGKFNGVQWLLKEHRNWIDAEFAINEGGGGELKNGKRVLNSVQASEKIYQTYSIEVKNGGGHSSRPTKDNAIYRLAEALARLAKFDFPAHLNEVTSAYFRNMADLSTGQLAADMRAITRKPPDSKAVARLSQSTYENALMRTTCVATMLAAGHAENALPQIARATVNCRILPGESEREVRATLVRVLDDVRVNVQPLDPATPSDSSPLLPEVMAPIAKITADMWPGVPVVPVMSTGATDGLYLRNAGIPTYGISGLFSDVDDNRAHGKDERVSVKAFLDSRDFLYRLVKAYSS